MDQKGISELARIVVDTILLDEETAESLRKLRQLSEETYEHVLNVAYMTAEILIDRCCREYELYEVVKGALLHDIGKLKVPKEILEKRTCLTDEEMFLMKGHPLYGLGYVYEVFNDEVSDIVKDIVVFHHEKRDGTGYPTGINICPWYVEPVNTVDAYDAMKAKRAYGKVRSAEEALEVLKLDHFSKTYIEDISKLEDK